MGALETAPRPQELRAISSLTGWEGILLTLIVPDTSPELSPHPTDENTCSHREEDSGYSERVTKPSALHPCTCLASLVKGHEFELPVLQPEPPVC